MQTEKGKWALCNNCGMQSADYNTCEGCFKEMPDEPKYTFDNSYGAAKKVSDLKSNLIGPLKIFV